MVVENPHNAGMQALTDNLLKTCPPHCNPTKKQKQKHQKNKLKGCGKKMFGSCKVTKIRKRRR
tara:strand:+ start:868 stop:1056 length:189 start_codon:yes stop_codon:yes gene_type:complete